MDTLTIRLTVQTPCVWTLFAALVPCCAAELDEPAAADEGVMLADVTDDIDVGVGRLAAEDPVAAAPDCIVVSIVIAAVCFVVSDIMPYPDESIADEGLDFVSCAWLVEDEMAALVLVTDLV